jgi:hypothetical protein
MDPLELLEQCHEKLYCYLEHIRHESPDVQEEDDLTVLMDDIQDLLDEN